MKSLEDEVKFLNKFIKKGNKKAREILCANILLAANKGEKDTRIAEILSTHRQTVWRIKRTYTEEGLESALKDKPRPGQPKKYEIKHETEIAALACTAPPEGRKKWTRELLQEELRTREGFKTVNRESIRMILKKNHTKPWLKRMWCIQKMDSEFVERMYDILDLYNEPYDPRRPVIGVDEKPKQLLEDSRKAIPMKPGSPEKYDYEYKRKGKANIFLCMKPKAGKRVTKVTDRRTKKDFANYIKDLLDLEYGDAKILRIVLDNLNTHFEKSFSESFDKKEAERILRKIEFYYTPKQGSGLNIAEIEINAMDVECTGRRRMENKEFLAKELKAWEEKRNQLKKKIEWNFTKQDADEKLSKHYVT